MEALILFENPFHLRVPCMSEYGRYCGFYMSYSLGVLVFCCLRWSLSLWHFRSCPFFLMHQGKVLRTWALVICFVWPLRVLSAENLKYFQSIGAPNYDEFTIEWSAWNIFSNLELNWWRELVVKEHLNVIVIRPESCLYRFWLYVNFKFVEIILVLTVWSPIMLGDIIEVLHFCLNSYVHSIWHSHLGLAVTKRCFS